MMLSIQSDSHLALPVPLFPAFLVPQQRPPLWQQHFSPLPLTTTSHMRVLQARVSAARASQPQPSRPRRGSEGPGASVGRYFSPVKGAEGGRGEDGERPGHISESLATALGE